MNKNINYKKGYTSPEIKCIKLDNEISLALQSDAPIGPFEEITNNSSTDINNEPFWSRNA